MIVDVSNNGQIQDVVIDDPQTSAKEYTPSAEFICLRF